MIGWPGFDDSAIPDKQRVAIALLAAAAPRMRDALSDLLKALDKETANDCFSKTTWDAVAEARGALREGVGE